MQSDEYLSDKVTSQLADAQFKIRRLAHREVLEHKKLRHSCLQLVSELEKVSASITSIEKLLGDVRQDSATPTANNLSTLTPRETNVLQLIAEGFSTKEIASRLNISFKTVVSHRTSILQKLDAHETATLVRIAIKAGLVRT